MQDAYEKNHFPFNQRAFQVDDVRRMGDKDRPNMTGAAIISRKLIQLGFAKINPRSKGVTKTTWFTADTELQAMTQSQQYIIVSALPKFT